jgi:hypothetical protein
MGPDPRWSQISANRPLAAEDAIQLPESGWGALIAWLAGPAWAHPALLPAVPPVTVRHCADGVVREAQVQRTPDDQASIDADIAQYLDDAGVPPAPTGTIWALRLPAGMDETSFWAAVHSGMDHQCPQARLPSQTRECLTAVLAAILRAR